MAAEVETVEDIDEALGHLSLDLADARRNNNLARVVVLESHIERLLDKRLALGPAEGSA